MAIVICSGNSQDPISLFLPKANRFLKPVLIEAHYACAYNLLTLLIFLGVDSSIVHQCAVTEEQKSQKTSYRSR